MRFSDWFGGESLYDKMRERSLYPSEELEMKRCRQALPGGICYANIEMAPKRSLA
jgi:hypothetical protein